MIGSGREQVTFTNNPLGIPAAPAGLSSQATEPMVSALRVSIPDAGTLARAGDCKLPTALCKTPWQGVAGFAAGVDNLQSPKKHSPSRLRRHGSQSKNRLSSPRLRRRDGFFFYKSEALQAAPICRKDWKPFVVLAISFVHQLRSHPCADCGSAGVKRTSHAKPPAAGASDRGSARLRLRAGRTTRSLLACLVPPSKRPEIVADRVRRLRTDVNHKRKGKTMSTTNNQSIRQINTSALRGTREAHQPDVVQLHPLNLEKNMTQTAQIDNALTFSTLEVTGDGYNKIALLNGKEWETSLWDYSSSRRLERSVPGGEATISESTDGKFRVGIEMRPHVARARVEKAFFGTLLECADFAEAFSWVIKEHAGYRWHRMREDIEYISWVAVVGVGDVVTLSLNKDGEFYIKRNISPRAGESYEFTALRYDSDDNKHAVRTFEEAAAIAIHLPSFLSMLGASS